MTLLLPLGASAPAPSHPSFILKPPDPQNQLEKAIKTILKAKRIVVICGAGISVHAGIPDFRSSEGLFQTLKRDNPKEALASGKDLFDASVFNSETMTSLFCQMISRLSDLSKAAEPTPFHKILHTLDTKGKLLRVYTQNIDAIEEKCGLTFGVPDFETKRIKSRAKGKEVAKETTTSTTSTPVYISPVEVPSPPAVTDPGPSCSRVSTPSTSTTTTSSSSGTETPRCIPLHGTLQTLRCQVCTHSFPLSSYLSSLASGVPPDCPECTSMEKTRQLVGKRARGVGRLRPSVVLYNEEHKDGEGVGEVVRRDLMGTKGRSGADLLLVVGTSLKVPGTKRMVREFAKAVHSRGSGTPKETDKEKKDKEKDQEKSPGPSQDKDEESQAQQSMKALYLNLDFPVPTREWEGVFDAWIQGDAQTFAEMLEEEIEREARAKVAAKEVADERKRKRELKEKEQEMTLASVAAEGQVSGRTKQTPTKVKSKSKTKGDSGRDSEKKRKKDQGTAASSHIPAKKRKVVVLLPTPKRTPKTSKSATSSSPSVLSRHQEHEPQRIYSPLHPDSTTISLPSPPSPKSASLSPSFRCPPPHKSHSRHSASSPDLYHPEKHSVIPDSFTSSRHFGSYSYSPPHSPTSMRTSSYSSNYPQSHPSPIPRTPISKEHPSRLNWNLPTPEQSPALHHSNPRHSSHSHHSRKRHTYESSSSHSDDAYGDEYPFYRTRSKSPMDRYSHSYHLYSSYPYSLARGLPPSPSPSPITSSRSHSSSRSRSHSGKTSRSSTPISSTTESEDETGSDTDTGNETEDTTEYTSPARGKHYRFDGVVLRAGGKTHVQLPLSTPSYGDTDMEIDVEGLGSPVDDLRNRFGMSCVRTTQVADGS